MVVVSIAPGGNWPLTVTLFCDVVGSTAAVYAPLKVDCTEQLKVKGAPAPAAISVTAPFALDAATIVFKPWPQYGSADVVALTTSLNASAIETGVSFAAIV